MNKHAIPGTLEISTQNIQTIEHHSFYVCVEVDGQTLFCTPTCFLTEHDAERWRKRWQEKLPDRRVFISRELIEKKYL
jgi:hypothetical protein